MIADTSSIAGYTILREEPSDAAPDLPTQCLAHPLDQLSIEEIQRAAKLIKEYASAKTLKFNCLTLREPKKNEYAAFKSGCGPRPDRRAFAIVIEQGSSQVSEVVVNLRSSQVEIWKDVADVGPTLTLEDLDVCESVTRKDLRVIEACREIGIHDMSKVFIDAWAIGFDHRWGTDRRLQQGIVYYRNSPGDNQYAHPLDFSVVVDTEKAEVLSVDIRLVNGERTRVPLEEHNYMPAFIGNDYQHGRLKPIDITQPQGVSFRMSGNEIFWAGLKMHIGFNYREGIVLSDVRIDDQAEGRERSLFNRISVVEMVVPYGNPDPPHHRKHAFDVGEYGTGLMTNSLKLGCDCKGVIHYIDAIMAVSSGEAAVLKNAICIHEEDNGLLYKHTDYRDGTVISARDRKLIISQIITAANYDETAAPYGTEVAPSINAHNHQHIFSLRVDPEVDGPNNTVVQNDAALSDDALGSAGNPHGNGFYCKKTPLRTALEGAADYCHETGRSWDIINPNSINTVAKKPVAYKILNNNCPSILAKPGSTVWKRAGFARKALWVTPYRDYELFPAGDYVCQSSGEGGHPFNETVVDWAARDEPIENTDIVCYIQFGLTHFPRTEDFPIMPAEPVGVMIRASNFFKKNPALWVAPSVVDADKISKNAFSKATEPAVSCCSNRDSKL
ncbi:primary-amine oxidase [Diaporthe amygdali]|uniref:primary-amine oxidase n=1 Tax=Phomopsis amygdali TaxID=1214568 RepID=UPI0022FE8CA4|nr:primary-amine oxidase [Diaporthe amygdali]KAJ0122494.1 primary-amine oxidase [Diaporthe amygdali]